MSQPKPIKTPILDTHAVAWHPIGEWIAILGRAGLWVTTPNLYEGKVFFYEQHEDPDKWHEITSAVWTPDGKHIICTTRSKESISDDWHTLGSLFSLDPFTDTPHVKLLYEETERHCFFLVSDKSNRQALLVSTPQEGDTNTLRLVDLNNPTIIVDMPSLKGNIKNCVWSADSKFLAISSSTYPYGDDPHYMTPHLNIWHKNQFQVFSPHLDWICALATHPTTSRLASSSIDGSAYMWDMDTMQNLFPLEGYATPIAQPPLGDKDLGRYHASVCELVWSPCGRYIAGISKDKTKLWYAEDGNLVPNLDASMVGVNYMVWHPTKNYLAISSDNHDVHILDLDSNSAKHLHSTAKGDDMDNWVGYLSWNPTGSTLVGLGNLGNVLVWDTSDNQMIHWHLAGTTELPNV